ncbi:MAG TPA: hypothetical protein PJ991_00145 [Kiritimatiellia bacterium]|nr:hypothetical protein [Kiritimatiellia bacterium]
MTSRTLIAIWVCLPAFSLADPLALRPEQTVQHMLDRWPINRPLPVLSMEQAYRYQENIVELLEPHFGPRVGYKAALTSEAMQKRFRHDQPVLGIVLKEMLLRDRVMLGREFATRPMIEADLMVMVKNESINDAQTHEEVIKALESVHPIIELPDLVFMEGTELQPLWLTAVNAGARAAVIGDPHLINGDPAWIHRIANIRASVMDKQGQVLSAGSSDRLLGHPLDVVLWIANEVKQRGELLKQGEVLWLGSMTDPLPIEFGESYQVLFTGMADYPVSLQVNFRRDAIPGR